MTVPASPSLCRLSRRLFELGDLNGVDTIRSLHCFRSRLEDEGLAMSEKSIADMPLYTNLDRIARGLSAHGIGAKDAIPPETLFDLDQ